MVLINRPKKRLKVRFTNTMLKVIAQRFSR